MGGWNRVAWTVVVFALIGGVLVFGVAEVQAQDKMIRVVGTVENRMDRYAWTVPSAYSANNIGDIKIDEYTSINGYGCRPVYEKTHEDVELWPYEWYLGPGDTEKRSCKFFYPTDDQLTLELSWATQSVDEDPGGDSVQDYTSRKINVAGTTRLSVHYVIRSNGEVCVSTGSPEPVARFSVRKDKRTVTVDASQSRDGDRCGSMKTYRWVWGDGSSDVGLEQTHTYSDLGEYDIELTVVNDARNTDSTERTVSISNHLDAGFTYSPPEPTTADRLDFQGDATLDFGSVQDWQWDFGDGSQSATQSPSHSYSRHGYYNITLSVTDSFGQTDRVTQRVWIDCADLVPVLETDKNGQHLELSASDSCSPAQGIRSYSWSVGNGTLAGAETSHWFKEKGDYQVTLNIIDTAGQEASKTAQITIDNFNPDASFQIDSGNLTTGQSLSLASHAEDPDGKIVGRSWDFGDGTTLEGQSPNHTYADDGTYDVTLTVTDDKGATRSISQQVTIENRPPATDQAEVSAEARSGTSDQLDTSDTIEFSTTVTDPDGEIVSWEWDFGDGTTATGSSPRHSYEEEGTYTVNLTVTDDDGDTATVSAQVTVTKPSVLPLALALGFFGIIGGGFVYLYWWDNPSRTHPRRPRSEPERDEKGGQRTDIESEDRGASASELGEGERPSASSGSDKAGDAVARDDDAAIDESPPSSEEGRPVSAHDEIGRIFASRLEEAGIDTLQELALADAEQLVALGLRRERAEELIASTQELLPPEERGSRDDSEGPEGDGRSEEEGGSGEGSPNEESQGMNRQAKPASVLDGVGGTLKRRLEKSGIETVTDVAAAGPDGLAEVRGIGEDTAETLAYQARRMAANGEAWEGSTSDGPHRITWGEDVRSLDGVGGTLGVRLQKAGIFTVSDLAAADTETIAQIRGISERRAQELRKRAEKDGER